MRPDAAVIDWMHEQPDHIETDIVLGCRLVEQGAQRVGHPEGVVHHLSRRGGRGCLGLEDQAVDRVYFRAPVLHLVVDDLGEGLLAQHPRVHEGQVAHVEEVLDGSRARREDAERARVENAAVGLCGLGYVEQPAVGLSHRGPQVAVVGQRGQWSIQSAGVHRRARRQRVLGQPRQRRSVVIPAVRHRHAEQLAPHRSPDRDLVECRDGVPLVDRHRIGGPDGGSRPAPVGDGHDGAFATGNMPGMSMKPGRRWTRSVHRRSAG